MSNLPAPPVPADVDLTDFRFMPLEVERLRRSRAWLICKRRPELAFFMLNLWTAAWHSRPAGSLEDDDDVLADAAMCSPERWPEIRADVMRGWFKAADGRLYHPVVAEKVLDSWHGKALARWRKECDRIRKENGRREKKGLPALDLPLEPMRHSIGFPEENPEVSTGIPPVGAGQPSAVPGDSGPPSAGHPPDNPRTVQGIPPENALKGEGEERDKEVRKSSEANASGRAPPDLATRIFGEGLAWLRKTTGKTDDACRKLLGKWRKSLTDEGVIAAIGRAQREAVTHPESWFAELIKSKQAAAIAANSGRQRPAGAADWN
jgi:hypothetical protein